MWNFQKKNEIVKMWTIFNLNNSERISYGKDLRMEPFSHMEEWKIS